MSSSLSKTLIKIFQPAKRLRSLSISGKLQLQSPSILTEEQRSRIEFNKYLASSKRNSRLCVERIVEAKAEGMDYVKLEELLVEETWLEALPGELQKPYSKNLCRFPESELRGTVPIYPPPHLIFNALNSTPFDRVKAVIIGQV